MTDDNHLKAKLIEDAGSAHEADRLLPTVRRLADWAAPTPSTQDTAQLVAMLQDKVRHAEIRSRKYMGLLIISQTRIVQQEIWLASALVMSLGVLVTLLVNSELTSDGLLLTLIAPIVTAIGIAYLYGQTSDPALEIELATPASPRLMLLVRLMLVFGFNLGLTLIGSIILAAFQADLSLGALIQTWLAPMTFLAALAFLASVFFADPLVGTILSLAIWSLQILRRVWPAPMPDLLSVEARPWLWLLALLFGAVAVWLAGREEQQLHKRI